MPESLLPFAVSDRDARTEFNTWLHGLWFAPTELKKLANLGQFGSVYVPYWTYDAMTYTHYTGQRGDDYWDTEYLHRLAGQAAVAAGAQDALVLRVRRGAALLRRRAGQGIAEPAGPPWSIACSRGNLTDLEPFREEFLSGHLTERYAVGLKEGFHEAKEIMEDHITGLIRQDIGGDHQRIDSRRTNHVGVTFKHILLPVWVANYRYREKLFQVLVNGRTGEWPATGRGVVEDRAAGSFGTFRNPFGPRSRQQSEGAKWRIRCKRNSRNSASSDAAARERLGLGPEADSGVDGEEGPRGWLWRPIVRAWGTVPSTRVICRIAQLGTAVHDPNVRLGFSPMDAQIHCRPLTRNRKIIPIAAAYRPGRAGHPLTSRTRLAAGDCPLGQPAAVFIWFAGERTSRRLSRDVCSVKAGALNSSDLLSYLESSAGALTGAAGWAYYL